MKKICFILFVALVGVIVWANITKNKLQKKLAEVTDSNEQTKNLYEDFMNRQNALVYYATNASEGFWFESALGGVIISSKDGNESINFTLMEAQVTYNEDVYLYKIDSYGNYEYLISKNGQESKIDESLIKTLNNKLGSFISLIINRYGYDVMDELKNKDIKTLANKFYTQTEINNMKKKITSSSSYISSTKSKSSDKMKYSSSDPYYSSNDHNHDGYLTTSEFQDAVGDYLTSKGY